MSILNDNLEEKLEEITPLILRSMGFTSKYPFDGEFMYADSFLAMDTTFFIQIVFPNNERYVSHSIVMDDTLVVQLRNPSFV